MNNFLNECSGFGFELNIDLNDFWPNLLKKEYSKRANIIHVSLLHPEHPHKRFTSETD